MSRATLFVTAVMAVTVGVLLVLWLSSKNGHDRLEQSRGESGRDIHESLRALLAQRREQHGDEHPETRQAMNQLAKALSDQGKSLTARKEFDEARRCFRQSLCLYREAGNDRQAAGKIFDLGVVAKREGDLPAARKLFEQSLAAFREAADARNIKAVTRALAELNQSAKE